MMTVRSIACTNAAFDTSVSVRGSDRNLAGLLELAEQLRNLRRTTDRSGTACTAVWPWSPPTGSIAFTTADATVARVLARGDAPEHGDTERAADLARRVVDRRADTGFVRGSDPMIESVAGAIARPMPTPITTSTSATSP